MREQVAREEDHYLKPLVQEPGGFYVSARIDTGPQEGRGGMDTYFPMPLDADVFEICDINLARGVHEEFLTSTKPEFEDRLGPPKWYRFERRALMREAPTQPFYSNRDIGTFVFDDLVRQGYAITDHREVDQHHYKERINDPRGQFTCPADGRKALFDPTHVRRLGCVDHSAYYTNAFKKNLRKKVGSERSERYPHLEGTALLMPILTRVTAGEKRGSYSTVPSNQTTEATILFEPYLDTKNDEATQHLPHHDDFEENTMLTYPQRLSLAARNAVWYRMKALEAAERNNKPEVVQDFLGRARLQVAPQEKPSTDVPEAKNATRSDIDTQRVATMHSLTTNIYLTKLDYDDFFDAVEKCDRQWATFMRAHPNYYYYADMFIVVTDEHAPMPQYLAENPEYEYAESLTPPRSDGTWATHDAPFQALYDVDPALFKFATRPYQATRERWFRDRKAFGGLPPQGEAEDPRVLLKTYVERWDALYETYMKDREKFTEIVALEASLKQSNTQLRAASFRLCWALARMHGAAVRGEPLYGADDAARTSAEELTRREQPPNEFQREHYRIVIPTFLTDALDNATIVRKQIARCKYIHAVVSAKESSGLKRYIEKEDKGAIPHMLEFAKGAFEWPTPERIDVFLSSGHLAAWSTLKRLRTADFGGWKTIKACANAFLRASNPIDPLFTLQPIEACGEYPKRLEQDSRRGYFTQRYLINSEELQSILEWVAQAYPDAGREWNRLATTTVFTDGDEDAPGPADGDEDLFEDASKDYVELLFLVMNHAPVSEAHVLDRNFTPITYAIFDAWRDWLIADRKAKIVGSYPGNASVNEPRLDQLSVRIPRSATRRSDLEGIAFLFGLRVDDVPGTRMLYHRELDLIEETRTNQEQQTRPITFFENKPSFRDMSSHAESKIYYEKAWYEPLSTPPAPTLSPSLRPSPSPSASPGLGLGLG